jgi:alkylation response protein AidB-like acyl-CoA dehydrogenase
MDFTSSDRYAGHRPAARRWAEASLRPEWVGEEHRTGTHHNRVLHSLLAAEGLLAAGWPGEYGGSDVDPGYAQAVFEEIAGYGLRMDGWITTWMVASTLLEVGTEKQKTSLVAAALRGEAVFVLGYTEPSCGSDVAAVRTRAVPAGGGWLINGAKMFTSTAHEATHVFLLARTNTGVPKHKGLTMFLVPLGAPGVEIAPIYTLGGQRTNATYYGDLQVGDDARVGPVDGGWGVMRVALVHERGAPLGRSGPTLLERFAQWSLATRAADGSRHFDGPGVRGTLARLAVDDEVARLLALRVGWVYEQGGTPAVEGAMAKLFSSERSQMQHQTLLDLLGADGMVSGDSAPLDGMVEWEFRNSVVSTIYGGTSEVMREIIAERRLGLPRSRPVG